MSQEEGNKDGCDEEMLQIGSAFGPASPIISVKNHIYLYDKIDKTVTRQLIVAMHEMAMEIIRNAVENNMPLIPIYLHLNSYGGSVEDSLAIVQVINDIQKGTIHHVGNIKFPIEVYTVIEGEADSCASWIACVGSKRFVSKYALSLIHEIYQVGGSGGHTDDIELDAANLKMFKNKVYDIYLSHSKLTKEKLAEICSKEDYSTPEQLLEWGLVDEIID